MECAIRQGPTDRLEGPEQSTTMLKPLSLNKMAAGRLAVAAVAMVLVVVVAVGC